MRLRHDRSGGRQLERGACPRDPLGRTTSRRSTRAWLARERHGGWSRGAMRRRARETGGVGGTISAINFEPDIRSNLLLAAARALAGRPAMPAPVEVPSSIRPSITIPGRTRATTHDALPPRSSRRHQPRTSDHFSSSRRSIDGGHRRSSAPRLRPVVAMHVSGGRPVKQWDPQRFGEVAQKLAASRRATILLTGSTADRLLVSQVKSLLPSSSVIDVTDGVDLLTLAALLAQSDLLVTGDTGPMHLAHRRRNTDRRGVRPVGSTAVRASRASRPGRASRSALCALQPYPPASGTVSGITPDCLALVSSDRVYDAAAAVLDQVAHRNPGEGGTARRCLGEGESSQTLGTPPHDRRDGQHHDDQPAHGGARRVSRSRDEEAAHRDAHAWIKNLRHAKVEGRGFRQRFTIRGDSLWWFTEIYLHKERALVDIHRAIAATRALLAKEQPSRLEVTSGSVVVRHVVTLVAKASGLSADGGAPGRRMGCSTAPDPLAGANARPGCAGVAITRRHRERRALAHRRRIHPSGILAFGWRGRQCRVLHRPCSSRHRGTLRR